MTFFRKAQSTVLVLVALAAFSDVASAQRQQPLQQQPQQQQPVPQQAPPPGGVQQQLPPGAPIEPAPQAAPGAPAQGQATAPPVRPQRVRNRPDLTCSNWFTACRRRGNPVAQCTTQRDECLQVTGCFTEEARFGGETFCQLQRR